MRYGWHTKLCTCLMCIVWAWHSVAEFRSLSISTKLNLGDRVFGEAENSFTALPGKEGHSKLIPSKLCVPAQSGVEESYCNGLGSRVVDKDRCAGRACIPSIQISEDQQCWHQLGLWYAFVVLEATELWSSLRNEECLQRSVCRRSVLNREKHQVWIWN